MEYSKELLAKTLLFGLSQILERGKNVEADGDAACDLIDLFSEALTQEERAHIMATALCISKIECPQMRRESVFDWSPYSQAGEDLIAWMELGFSQTPTRQ